MGCSTFEVLHATFFPGLQPDAVKSNLRRLCADPPDYRYLRPERLDAHRTFYRLTHRGIKFLGASKRLVMPLGPQTRIEKYALLWLCFLEKNARRVLLNLKHHRNRFPMHGHTVPRHPLVLEKRGDQAHLAMVLIDYCASHRRIAVKAADQLLRILQNGLFEDEIRSRAFRFVILTYNQGKKQAIERVLRPLLLGYLRKKSPITKVSVGPGQEVELEILVVPGLENLLLTQGRPFEGKGRK